MAITPCSGERRHGVHDVHFETGQGNLSISLQEKLIEYTRTVGTCSRGPGRFPQEMAVAATHRLPCGTVKKPMHPRNPTLVHHQDIVGVLGDGGGVCFSAGKGWGLENMSVQYLYVECNFPGDNEAGYRVLCCRHPWMACGTFGASTFV